MVSIITVNYNGLADTCEMIASFRKYETHPYEIIVVDNGSQNPEADEIKTRHPEIKVVQNTNTGFAGGNNAGLKVAQGEYLFFLNNDTLIQKPRQLPVFSQQRYNYQRPDTGNTRPPS